jgi:hypothetical protein
MHGGRITATAGVGSAVNDTRQETPTNQRPPTGYEPEATA